MTQLHLIAMAAMMSVFGTAVAAEESELGSKAADQVGTGCTQTHSRALCIAKAGHIAGAMKDMAPGELKLKIENTSGDALWYAGAAAGSATNVFRHAKGIPQGAEVGLLLLGMLGSIGGKTELVGRNLVLAWMPAGLASSKEEANERAEQMLLDATFQSFPGSTITVESTSASQAADPFSLKKADQIRYRVTGGICAEHECFLMPQMKTAGGTGVMGARAYATKAPDFVGGGDSYQYATRIGALYVLALIVDGKLETHTYMQELSKRLPDWAYAVASPETKLAGGQMMNDGLKVPVMYNQGKPMYFSYPGTEPKDSSTASAN